MLDMQEIEDTIHKLEECGDTTYSTCQKLAILYIVRDHYKGEMEKSSSMSSSLSASNGMVAPAMGMMK